MVGDRVLCSRNSYQVFEIIERADGDLPTGTIVSAKCACDAVPGSGQMVEAELIGTAVCVPLTRPGFPVEKGERVILDPSNTFVIGSLGKPPAMHAFTDKVDVQWDEIGGHEVAKATLREDDRSLPHSHPELFAAYGMRTLRGILIEGPVRHAGKTLLAKAAATALARAHGSKGRPAGSCT